MKKINYKSIYIVFALIIVMVITSIYKEYQSPLTQHRVFGVTYMTMNNPFYEVINNELVKVIEEKGDQLLVRDPALDVDKQMEQIYAFIDRQVDGIFINPIDSNKMTPALQAAREAKIPVIIVDAPVENSQLVESTIVSDNYDAGVQCAKDMMQKMDSAHIMLLKHTNVKSAKDRIDGFLDTIEGYPQYQVIDEGECEGQLELAMPLMEKMLDNNSHVDVVMALNDPSALGALAALESRHIQDVIVYGIDGTPDLKSLINSNKMVAGTVAQSPISIGNIAAKKMYELLSGKEIEKEIAIPVQLITEENIALYDEKGWQ